jgi:aquaporin Z
MDKQTKMVLTEMAGTFVLALAVLQGLNGALALGVLVLMIGAISGAHLNPAITAALVFAKKFKASDALYYICAQVMGALFAKAAHLFINNNVSSFEFAFKASDTRHFVAEIIGMAIFASAVLLAVRQKYEGVQLAATVAGGLFIGAAVGCSVNPAVAMAMGQNLSWTTLVAPFIGSYIAAKLVTSKK